jgi:F0F1-type ATP synthase beta subunit
MTLPTRGEIWAVRFDPFICIAPFTDTPRAIVSLPETLDSMRRILDGAADDIEVEGLRYVSRLPHSGAEGR